jgi:hypothetical protein
MKNLITIILAVAIVFNSTASGALTLVPRAMACMLYFRSDAVFTGKVVLVKEDYKSEDSEKFLEGTFYTLKIIKAYHGINTPTIRVYTSNDSGRLPLELGKKYLLFADKEGSKLIIADNGVSGELKDSKQALKDLDKIMDRTKGEGGDVYARVVEDPWNADTGGVSGIHITVSGSAESATGVTNKNGWVHMHIPAGMYSAKASDPKWVFSSQDIAWENSDNFSLPNGGCAEIQINAKPAPQTNSTAGVKISR